MRVQLSRAAGWRLPPRARSVAYPTPYANPFRPERRTVEANSVAVERYRQWLAERPDLIEQVRGELAGKDLACWCAPHLPCHADVLLDVAAGADP
ncbi:DUF4326 domain-containing protein [Luteipulveratus sp. YIM 133132]|uniref:DUF4326 domain-containing protein n=1 Tax=Luteipulveratus flavus TaxID=3031728 RepID=A0ABT6C4C7_9MICO|nr:MULTISPECIES: DUF4326 domain-containing protein [unclassified Luteipulveratus]MDE9364038.1 DUF4326 domain-containing protein [Luteipulveratus sp. YIM 133132]MDF8263541.1 DUF4326 domain-containing protein [Luteipulveratus sp. YIM 133296]